MNSFIELLLSDKMLDAYVRVFPLLLTALGIFMTRLLKEGANKEAVKHAAEDAVAYVEELARVKERAEEFSIATPDGKDALALEMFDNLYKGRKLTASERNAALYAALQALRAKTQKGA